MSKPIEAVKQSIRDAISDDPQPDWKDSLGDALDTIEAIEAERDDLLAALESIASRPYVDDWMKTIACEAVAKAKAGGAK